MNRHWVVIGLALAGCGSDGGGGDDGGGSNITPDAAINVCGDGVMNPVTEACDDGNTLPNDGCSPTCTVEQPQASGAISVSWELKNLATNTNAQCPNGFDTAAVYNQPIDANGNNAGAPIIDLFDCVAGSGTVTDLAPTRYRTWIAITDHNDTQTYAQSLSAIVDVTYVDRAFSAHILTDGGYFQVQWNLVGKSSGAAKTCAQAGADGVELIATDVATPANASTDIFDCTDGAGVTAGFLAATYTVSISALNAANQAIGTAATLTNKVIAPKNAVTNLGTVSIPIDGQ